MGHGCVCVKHTAYHTLAPSTFTPVEAVEAEAVEAELVGAVEAQTVVEAVDPEAVEAEVVGAVEVEEVVEAVEAVVPVGPPDTAGSACCLPWSHAWSSHPAGSACLPHAPGNGACRP